MLRYVARRVIDRLVEDGRIHPARIEETVELVKEGMDGFLLEEGRDALFHLEIPTVHNHLAQLVGRLRLRSASGQNLLEHSVEVAKMAAFMAQNLDFNVEVCLRAGILHEIGQFDEMPKDDHPYVIAANTARRFGEPPKVYQAIQSLHPNFPPQTSEGALLRTAERLAQSFPGISKEGLERHIQRLDDLEALAKSFPGVSSAYCLRAGRELMVMVDADEVDDDYTRWLAKDIADRLRFEHKLPGRVRVVVLRETRVVDYAV